MLFDEVVASFARLHLPDSLRSGVGGVHGGDKLNVPVAVDCDEVERRFTGSANARGMALKVSAAIVLTTASAAEHLANGAFNVVNTGL